MKLLYITNRPEIAVAAQDAGVDRIFVDLESRGKSERQPGGKTVISNHRIDDVRRLRPVITTSELLVRINGLFDGSADEIDAALEAGADRIMLPMFQTAADAERFIHLMDGRAKTVLLLETKEAAENIDSILSVPGIDEIHIGLNDLHLSLGYDFMFELLADGTVERLCQKLQKTGIPYGFGGVAAPGQGAVLSDYILAEHRRLGSTRVILSRSFCDTSKIHDLTTIQTLFTDGVASLRRYEAFMDRQSNAFFVENYRRLCENIAAVSSKIKAAAP